MGLIYENHWHLSQGVWADPDLQRVKRAHLKYVPRPFSRLDCLPDAVCTLRGPRRAGKTVAFKLLIADLIESKTFAPQEIYWTSFETLRTLAQLEDRLRDLWKHAEPRILFIDEVTAVLGWQRVIKKLKDEGYFAQSTLFLTGSSAHDLRAGAERMAGRRGTVWTGVGKQLSEPERAEMVVGIELLRRYELRQWEGLSSPRNVFTWKSSSGNEVDFLAIHVAKGIREPFEVKYQNQIRDADFQVMEKSFGKGTLLTLDQNRGRPKSRAISVGEWCLDFPLSQTPQFEGVTS